MSEKEIAWDLTEIFSSCDDPEISKTMDGLMEKANEIIIQYRGKINKPNFTVQNLHDLLEKYEDILARLDDLGTYSITSFHANMTLPEIKTLYNKVSDFQSTISKKFAFLELEVGNLINNNSQVIRDRTINNYIMYLENIR
ncbi:hypothetical protein LCGC14_1794390 [marine sediment metagenome]|uniref:Oligopeptidase F N-terminal domain-containing protein n=1 Tax=marine sediment metagenome TaxID=412755 RepID=A0A0F9HE86_9ZZZZ